MIIIQIMNEQPLPRLVDRSLQRAARTMPVVVDTGARQTGKSTLVRDLVAGERLCLPLDDLDVRDQATNAPDDLVARGRKMTLDEIQRAPDLMLAVKRAVDAQQQKGKFFL